MLLPYVVNDSVPSQDTHTDHLEGTHEEPTNDVISQDEPSVPPRRSNRERRPAIPNDYIVYLQEHVLTLGFIRTQDPIKKPKSIFTPING